jgi:hypothetical protein
MTDSALRQAQVLLSETRDELNKADSKVSVLLATSGVMASVLAGSGLVAHGRLTHLPIWAQILWWLGVLAGTSGIVALATALMPRMRHHEEPFNVRYFGHAATFSSPAELSTALQQTQGQEADRAIDQLWVTSRIVVRKYVRIRYALIAYGAAVSLIVAALIA